MQAFDFSPLTGPVDQGAVAALRRESIADKVAPAGGDDLFAFWLSVIAFPLEAALLLWLDTSPVLQLWAKVAITLMLGPGTVAAFLGIFLQARRLAVRWTEFYRAKQFAMVNAMTYSASDVRPTWDSMVFRKEAARYHSSHVFTATRKPLFEAGNYVYEVLVEKKLVAVAWGYLVVDLGRPVAPIVLRSRSRASERRWAAGAYSRNPVLTLGADLDRRFRLYCPNGAEHDARLLFTPELIGALRPLGRSVDVEVSGNFLFVYTVRRFAFPRPQVVQNAFAVISLVSALADSL